MNVEKKLCWLLVPFVFIIILYIPGMILDIVPHEVIQEMPDELWHIFLAIKWPALFIWTLLFFYIPTFLYIAMALVYTVVSWRWILKQKKGNAMYAIVWLVLCLLSILMYWKLGPIYYATIIG